MMSMTFVWARLLLTTYVYVTKNDVKSIKLFTKTNACIVIWLKYTYFCIFDEFQIRLINNNNNNKYVCVMHDVRVMFEWITNEYERFSYKIRRINNVIRVLLVFHVIFNYLIAFKRRFFLYKWFYFFLPARLVWECVESLNVGFGREKSIRSCS